MNQEEEVDDERESRGNGLIEAAEAEESIAVTLREEAVVNLEQSIVTMKLDMADTDDVVDRMENLIHFLRGVDRVADWFDSRKTFLNGSDR